MTAAIRTLLVEDETLVRQGIRKLLELDPRIEVAAEAADGEEALRRIGEDRPDVVLLDVRMPKLDGLGVLRALRDRPGAPPCLVLTTFDDRALALEAIREGARGYLRKDVTLGELVAAVETLAAGGTHLQPALTAALLEGARAHPLPAAPEPVLVEPLTPRETEVLRLM
ncbi:MAG: DNA-binding response regulator, partial [Acidobacteria bacterium]